MQHQQKLPRTQKFELWRENMKAGKQLHDEFTRKSKLSQEEWEAEKAAESEYREAEMLAAKENISFVDALDKVKTNKV